MGQATTNFSFAIQGVSATLLVAKFELVEAMSGLFQLELTFASDDKDIAFADAVGKDALFSIEVEGADTRFVHGLVSRLRLGDPGKKLSFYEVTVVPKLWRLSQRRDSRIFQEKSVPDILQEVLTKAGVTDVRLSLTGSYTAREYCVQYRESDLAFLSRLMEEEGISYHFEHTADEHTLVLSDSTSAVAPIPSPDTVAWKTGDGALTQSENVNRFSTSEEVRPGKVTLTDYNFKKPSLSLMSNSSAELDTDLEEYDYPGEYDLPGDGKNYARVRLEEWQARRVTVEGASDCPRLIAGFKFTLSEHPRDAENREYLLLEVRHRGASPVMAEQGDVSHSYANTFRAMPADKPHRPARTTPRPTIKGVQTAIVTGPGGEEIHTDEHGRVKVHFHWDRLGAKDDKSSCWVRVSQLWAGAGFGAMWIPRIGHEVVVDFIEGDPDRPLIVGRVYHGANLPPYGLPAEKTKSTIKSNSSIGGGGYNELRFEDMKGSEEVYLHGQKDWTIKIENDKNQEIGHDETLKVGHDRSKEVNNDQSEKIGNNKSITVGGSHTETISEIEAITVGAASMHTVGGAFTETIGAAKASTVGGTLTEIIASKMSLSVGGDRSETMSADFTQSVAKDAQTTVAGKVELTVKKDMTTTIQDNENVSVGKKQSIAVGEQYQLTVGDAKVTLKKNGDITIEGKKIVIKGSGPIQIEGSKVAVKSDGSVEVKAGGSVKVKGSGIEMN